jgi:hypothetical protein
MYFFGFLWKRTGKITTMCICYTVTVFHQRANHISGQWVPVINIGSPNNWVWCHHFLMGQLPCIRFGFQRGRTNMPHIYIYKSISREKGGEREGEKKRERERGKGDFF